MSTLSPERWQAVSPRLDQALEMPQEERAAWVAELREQDPALAADLQALLDEHDTLAHEGFLEQPPEALPGQPRFEGRTIGAYTLESPIGQGGMGTVWLARRSDGRYERRVAVKFPSVALLGSGGGERFKREGSFLGRLSHPHIADLIDAGVASDGQPYLVLEHVDGDQIDRYCDRKGLDVEARVRLFLDVLAAVAHAHASLIVHRDIKPSNVLVTTDGRVKLLDFGIAKLLQSDASDGASTRLTREGGGAMTPEYAAPEQVMDRPVTTATDVYALGVLLYLLLTGEHPAGPGPHSAAELVKAIVDTEPPRPSDVVTLSGSGSGTAAVHAARRSTTPERLHRVLLGDLDTIVAKALKKDPQERYPSVTALADDLRRYLKHEPIDARPDTLSYRTAKFVRRNRTAVALATLVFIASIAGVAGTLIQARTARAERDFAFRELARAEATNDLNSFLLSDAAPSGKPFTVDDLLARAEHVLDRQRGEDASRLDLLISIGRQYDSQDEDEKARRLLDEAYALSRNLSDASIRARASCALGGILSRGPELPRADPLIQEGLRELTDEPQFALDRVFCLMRGSQVSRNSGKSQEAVARVLEARRVLRQSGFDSDLQELRLLMDLAESYRVAGRSREAIAAFEEASARLTSLGRDDTQTAGTLFNNWALTLNQLGRPIDAERIYRRAIDISRDNRGEETVSPMLLVNYSRALESLNRLDEAADYGRRGYAKALADHDEVVVNQALLELAFIHRKQGDFERASEALDEVEPRLRRALPPGHLAFASLASQRSLIALERGDAAAALPLADQAISIVRASVKAGGEGAGNLPSLLVRRADVELEIRQFDQAVADASQAVEMLRKSLEDGTLSSIVGRAFLTLGRALQAKGKTDEALTALRTALEHLDSSVGSNHPDSLQARRLLQTGALNAQSPAPGTP